MGKLAIEQALQRGHRVTALVRTSSSLATREGLTIVEGTPLNRSDIERAEDAVPGDTPTIAISTLGQQRKSGSPWAAPISPPNLVTEAVSNLVIVAQAHDIEKLIVLSMFGAGRSFSNLQFMMRWIMKNSNMVQTIEDHNSADEVIRKAPIPFVLVRAAMLWGDEVKPVKVLDDEGNNAGAFPWLSAGSAAKFLIDAAEKEAWDKRSPVIRN